MRGVPPPFATDLRSIHSPSSVSSFLLVALGLWLLSAPYGGIVHDAALYAADALRHLYPQGLGQDLFFQQNTQGDYSLFGRPYAVLMGWLGVDSAAYAMTLAGRVLWASGVIAVCRAGWQRQPWHWEWLVAIILVGPHFFDGHRVFSSGEPFATPRLFAEAAGLWAIAQVLQARTLVAGALGLLSIGLHPLMGIPVLVVLVLMLPRGRLIAGACGLAVLWLGSQLDWPVFNRLTEHYDATWWDLVLHRNTNVLPFSWDSATLVRQTILLVWLGTTGVYLAPFTPQLARLASALALGATVLYLAWWVGSSTHNVLLIQLQLWRVGWLVTLLAPALWATTLWARVPQPGLRCLHLGLSLLAFAHTSPWSTGLGVLSPLLLMVRPAAPWLARHDRLSANMGIGLVALSVLARLLHAKLAWQVEDSHSGTATYVALLVSDPVLMWPVLVGMGLLLGKLRAEPLRLLVGLCSLFAAIALSWRPPHEKADRSTPAFTQTVNHWLAPDAVVMTDLSTNFVWYTLHRANYASRQQGAGSLFGRSSAIELARRLDLTHAAGFAESNAAWNTPSVSTHAVTPDDIARLCRDAPLDAVLLQGKRAGYTALIASPSGKQWLSLYLCHSP